MDEYLDIVDVNDNVLGKKLRAEIYQENLSNFRVVNAFIMNDHGQLWIPRRTVNKEFCPSCLDSSMGGHVISGETYKQAFKREVMEELRIDVDLIKYKYLGSLNPYQHNTSAFMQIYLIYSNDTPNYNAEDFVEYFWLSPKDLLSRLDTSDIGKDDLYRIVKFFFNL